MRVNGRIIRPSTLAERRFLLSLGVCDLRVPRRMNPYVVGRRLSKSARGVDGDILFARELVARHMKAVDAGATTPEAAQ